MRRLTTLLACLVAVLALSACSGERMTASAEFDDVVDLAVNNAVKIADVSVGRISGVVLSESGDRAVVEMVLDDDIALPSRVTARLRKTNVLGERFVELVPDRDSGGAFASGTRITDTVVVAEIEEAIITGTDVVLAISADTLAGAIQAGATGLDGRGGTLGSLIEELGTIVAGYDRNSEDLVRLLSGFEQFLAEVGPQADLHGRAVGELAAFTRTLSEEDERLIDTLVDIQQLANTGTDIMRTHARRTDDFFTRFEVISGEITAREADLNRVFNELNGHNFNTIRGINSEHAQIIADFIVCGINDTPGDAVRACDDPPQAQPKPTVRDRQDF